VSAIATEVATIDKVMRSYEKGPEAGHSSAGGISESREAPAHQDRRGMIAREVEDLTRRTSGGSRERIGILRN
jgi:hypothetical protein